jgi:hypothetical protein
MRFATVSSSFLTTALALALDLDAATRPAV